MICTASLAGRAWSGIAVAALALFFVSMYTVLLALVQFAALTETQQVVFQTILFHWAGLAFIAGHARSVSMSWAELYGLRGRFFRRTGQIAKYYLAMMVVVFLGAVGWGNLLQVCGVKPELQEVVTIILNAESPLLKGYLIFLAVVLAAVFEELIFRGIIFPVLVKRMPVRPAAFLLSLGFALMHANLLAFFPLLLVSLCLCYAYWRTGSLWVNIGMHMLFNGINLIFMSHFGQ